MKTFLFLYPIPENINWEIKQWAPVFTEYHGQPKKEIDKEFEKIYASKLNACIDMRYRQKEFQINFALFKDKPISPLIQVAPSDCLIYTDIDYKTHTTKRENGRFPYPKPEYLLNQLNNPKTLWLAGFHLWDCVERVAKAAYERGIDTKIDEDLTDLFCGILNQRKDKFSIGKFPNYDTWGMEERHFRMFMMQRTGKPWLFQDYPRPEIRLE